MRIRKSSWLGRTGIAALLAAAGLTVAGTPAHAANEAYLSITPSSTQLANGVTKANAKPFQFKVINFVDFGSSEAKDVTVTVDVNKLDKTRVGYVVPNGCIADPGAPARRIRVRQAGVGE
jgi:hypothetical protein